MTQRFVSLNFSVEGDVQVANALDFVGAKIDDFSSPLLKSKDLLMKTFDKNFLKNGSVLGEPWAPLAPSTLTEKNARYGKRRTLEATGAMRKSFTGTTTKQELIMENTAEYFKYHQSNKSRKKLPRRVMMKIDEKRRTEIVRNFTEYLAEVRGHFGNHRDTSGSSSTLF